MEKGFRVIRILITLLFIFIANTNCDFSYRDQGLLPRKIEIQTQHNDSYPIESTKNWTDQSEIENSDNSAENCSARSIHNFPHDVFNRHERQKGAVIFHIFFGFYCFLMTAYVCNDYLLPALDCICADLNISADVAGATFLATASCFPELFVNVVGTFLTESDLGVGTVVGSAVFNTFVTPACGALSAAEAIHLKWGILSRDCIIYIISVSSLVLIMWDGVVTWYEATVLLMLFAGYFSILFFSRRITRLFARMSNKRKLSEEKSEDKKKHDTMPHGTYKPFFHGELVIEYRNSLAKVANLKAAVNGEVPPNFKEALEIYVEPETIFIWPRGGPFTLFWFIVTWPIRILLFITIPDTRYKRFRNWYPVTFLMCVIWIAISSYLVSWMTTIVGDTLGIPDSVMGITFLSAGGNMPEMVSIVILSRRNHGDMAMSNTLGANTLDILLCLGLPWTIKVVLSGKNVQIVSGAIAYTVFAIIICVIGFYTVTAFYGFKLNKQVGVTCLCMYSMFLVVAILLELNTFFFVNLPTCEV
ncbi:sodium/potassium/calcium exchanger 4-like [Belonocnema kinseyi]|uniref:sodium/potassium/calcium exchanger 4-like n=1 Tax=Belonocnema kinseyi TaxID=2817044 RepID=UPI00143DF2D6|nr:sodium/potassium/calcium exchanger 4-like [Belonocnema kinseyi]XP_033211119.1 sodium/potassium/calcium exchanger 4-like [Belonocnema kinseyi]XP_033211120.1 sodium/potassium/calcium exchanger 4-like [Belonocnema kinseyi]XP_033211121.1 sodium/potassium/calcium exchanger 4-like [Belonocnema kinseyi]XP_033211122.1 sodium/potassium/calcium exchanger 4-like [Belonocnema kinseyi]